MNGLRKTGTIFRGASNSRKLKVLIIAQYFPSDMGGGATRAYNVAKGLVLNGCRVTVISAFPHYPHGNIPPKYRWKPLKIEYMDGIKVIRTLILPITSKGLVRRMVLFATFIFSSLFAIPLIGDIDVIWAANPNILSIIPAMIYGFIKRAPVTLNVDDPWPEDLYSFKLVKKNSYFSKIAEFLARMAYHYAKIITPISPGYIKIISGRYGVDRKKIHIIRAGVDIHKFKPLKKVSDNNEFKIVYTGAFSIAYDFDQILLAAKILEKKNKNIKFILQGGGELANYIKTRVKNLGLKNVKVIDKIVSRDKVAEILNMADVLILPLRDFGKPYLGISSKLYEYQAVGKPIICCAIGQPAEYIKETKSGIIVKPGKYKKLAEAVLYLCKKPIIIKNMGDKGRQY
ncbi:MAG TPA: glycosyltransferase WbuB, partial [Thermoprotei archaeon]|nr:glycosyltransferase WbuB [Thermoprotei archaeon]